MKGPSWMYGCLPDCKFVGAKIGGQRVKLPVKYKMCWFDIRRFAAGVAVTGATTELDMFDTNAAVANTIARFYEQPVRGCEAMAVTRIAQFKLDPWQLPTENPFLEGIIRGYLNENETLLFEMADICAQACIQCDIAGSANSQTFNAGDSLVTLGGDGACVKPFGLTSEDRLRVTQTVPVNVTPRGAVDIWTVVMGYLVGYDGDECRIDIDIPTGDAVPCDDVRNLPDGSVQSLT